MPPAIGGRRCGNQGGTFRVTTKRPLVRTIGRHPPAARRLSETGKDRKMKIAKETWVILFIGLADLITTIVFIQHHGAREANPLFRRYWEMGLVAFILAKMAMLVGPLCVLEWARKRNPRFVNWALRGAIAAYLVMYSVGFVHLNRTVARADQVAVRNTPPPQAILYYNQMMRAQYARHYHLKIEPKAQSARGTLVTTF